MGSCRSLCIAFASSVSASLALSVFSLGVWNVVISSRALGLTENGAHAHLRAFLIVSIVCSASSILSCGLMLPVPHLVFAILGQVWHEQEKAMGGYGAPILLETIRKSVMVLWFTVGASVVLWCAWPFAMGALIIADEKDATHAAGAEFKFK